MSLHEVIALAVAKVCPETLKAITIIPSSPYTKTRVYGSGEGWHMLLFYLAREPSL